MNLAKVLKVQDNKVILEFEDDINTEYLDLLARGKENFATVKFLDEEPRTLKQNALSHALINDIAFWYGDYPKVVEEEILKPLFESSELFAFEHSKAGKSDAASWINFLIEFTLSHGVEIPKRYSYLLENDKFFYYCCKYRKCAVCGKSNAQLHHVKAVGNRHRNQVDHRQFPFASLCWLHHNIAHKLGQIEFLDKLKIIPVFLDRDTLVKLGIMSNRQIMNFDKKYADEEQFLKAGEEG